MNLKKLLGGVLSENELSLLVKSFDVVGDIAITIIPPELSKREAVIGQAILSSNKRIKAVARRAGNYQGQHRTIALRIIAGEDRLETEHREFGVRLRLNLESVYFSVRSGTERKRIADLTTPGEDVLVMFSGVAPYPLIIARHAQAHCITGIEINATAHDFALQNRRINKFAELVDLYCGDVTQVLPRLNRSYHRIIMPFPSKSADYAALALAHLRKNGWLHYYAFQTAGNFDASVAALERACLASNRELVESRVVTCGHKSPEIHRLCIDARIR
jgi:tRNA (guanine37-N1)-methyltransferase